MRKQIKLLIIPLVIILFLSGCEKRIDIILTDSTMPTPIDPSPDEKTDIPPKPTINEMLDYFLKQGQDIDIIPVEETEESALAKKFITEMRMAVDCIGTTPWNSVINIDEYIEDGYLKDYILFKLNYLSENPESNIDGYEIKELEAVEQVQVGDITYVKVKFISLFLNTVRSKWIYQLKTEWAAVRDGRIVDESILAGENIYNYLHIDMDIVDEFGVQSGYSFPPKRNPWDSRKDIEDLFRRLNSQGYDIIMKPHPYPDKSYTLPEE